MIRQKKIEPLLLRFPISFLSRIKILFFRALGMKLGKRNRFEGGRIRRINQLEIGNLNAFSKGWCLWPEDTDSNCKRINIGSNNYFNRNLMIDACNKIEIGNNNMFGPDVYITDSNHRFELGKNPSTFPMEKGTVKIGNSCWIGAKVVILKDVTIGDYCVVGAGAVVTKSFPAGSVIAGVPAKVIKSMQSG